LPLHRKTEATAGDFARGVRVYFRGEYRIPEESNRFIRVSFPRHLFGMTKSKSPVHGSHKSSSKKIIPQTPLVRGEVVNKTQMNGLRVIFSDLFSDITATYAHEGQPKGVYHHIRLKAGYSLGGFSPGTGIKGMDEPSEGEGRRCLVRKLISPKKPARVLNSISEKMDFMTGFF
jgi:hypothetical protein